MSEISELEGRLSRALERIARGVDAMQAVVGEPEDSEDIQALRRALESEAQVTAEMEERLREVSARQSELEAELAESQDARLAAESSAQDVEADKAAAQDALMAAEARATAAETAAADAADKLEVAQTEIADAQKKAEAAEAMTQLAEQKLEAAKAGGGEGGNADERDAMLNEFANRLRRLRQATRRERGANKRLMEQVEGDGRIELSAVELALKADLETLTALREAEAMETAVILAELRTLVQSAPAVAEASDLDAAMREEAAQDVAETELPQPSEEIGEA